MAITDNLEKMLASGRDSAMLRFGLGSAYFNQRQFLEAIEHLRACIEQDANYTAAYKLLGKSLMKSKQPELAQEVFERGLPVALAQGDKQTEREIKAFLAKLSRT
jgi:Tfp pilus assembly protein PilF